MKACNYCISLMLRGVDWLETSIYEGHDESNGKLFKNLS